jgi:hypothetical protein
LTNNYVIDLTKPPVGPPSIVKRPSIFSGLVETKESKKRTASWHVYREEYIKRLREKRQNDKN